MMLNGFCHFGNWGSFGNFGVWGWIGLIFSLIFWVGLIASLTLLVIWAIRRARVPAATVPYATGQPTAGVKNTAKEILQARFARGEITREQYQQMLDDLG
jgi:putative membrane protein